MSDLRKFLNDTLKDHEEKLKKLEEFQELLKATKKQERTIYPTYDVVSNT